MNESLVRPDARRARSPWRVLQGSPFPLTPVLGGLLLLLVVVPVLALLWRALASPSFWPSLRAPLVLDALRLTLVTSFASLAAVVALGTPLAFLLARRSFRGKWLVELGIDLPLVLPPVVAGVTLLMAFGRRGLLGQELALLGIELPFTTAAVVLAQLFVAAPFYVRGARLGLQAVPRDVEEAAAIDGASPWATFRYITLPLAWPGLASGAVLCWARAVSEFGNIGGRTQTMSLAIMSAMESDLGVALALAAILVVTSAGVLLLSRALTASSAPDR